MVGKLTINRTDDSLLINSINIKPDYNIAFWTEKEEVGRLEWNDGVMKFSGDMDEAAKKFFEFLKPLIDHYIQSELKKIHGVG